MNRISDAIAAYASVAAVPAATPVETSKPMSGAEFGTMVKDAAQDAIAAAKGSEKLSQEAIAGKADIRDVVAAVTNAELTLDTVVAIRDRVIGAYKEITQMPI